MKQILLFFTLLTTAVTYGQDKKFSFKLGDEYELPKDTRDLAYFGNEKDGIVNLSLKKEDLYIVRFDPKNLNKTMEQKVDLAVTGNFVSEMLVDFNNNNYYWLHSDWDKSAKQEILYSDKIDVTHGSVVQPNTPLFKTTKIAEQYIQKDYEYVDKYQFNYDAEHKKLMVSYRLIPEFKSDKKNYDRMGFQVFDEHLNKIWGDEFKMPYTEAIMDNKAFSIDSKGNAYMLAKVYDSEIHKEMIDEKPNYHYEVLKFGKDSRDIVISAIPVGNYFIKQTNLIENAQHEMIIACTFSKKARGTATDGFFLAIENSEGKISNYKSGYYEFPKAELAKFESEKKQERIQSNQDFEVQDLFVRDVLANPDGSVFVSLEKYFIEVGAENDKKVINHYGDIYACLIGSTGKLEWLRKIHKMQRGSGKRATLGYKLINDPSGFYFLYMDNRENMNLGEGEAGKYYVDGKGGQLVVTKIDYQGNISKELLFDTRDEDIMIYPAEFDRINDSQFIGRAMIKKKLFQPLLIGSK
ncbi:MAG TPA: hypothetical protein VG890_05700 [Puia sp.]|nr:hypothetical protein [Puia sp.]